MHRRPARNENGFTLIEVIVSLLLIGILASLAGMFLVAITNGYVFSQQNNETSLKAQVALAKMVKEISSLGIETGTITAAAVTVAQPTSISYTYTDSVTGTITHTIAQNGAQIQFDGIPLVDTVTAFALTYFDNAGAATATPAAIRRVDISLSLQGAGGVISTFADNAKILESYF
jgi:prepilin-type N-terminal cleavage/methylation domain-containing protein